MTTLASIRPDSWNLPLLVHVLGAMILVGAATAGGLASLAAVASPDAAWLRRFSFRALLLAGVPSYLAMHGGAEWIREQELGDADDPTWVGIGYITADLGGLLLLVSLVLAGIALRRSRAGLSRAAGWLTLLAVLGWLVAVWAMAGKPG